MSLTVEQFIEAALSGNTQIVAQGRGTFSPVHQGLALLAACEKGHTDIVDEFVRTPDSEALMMYANDALQRAAQFGHDACVKLVLPHADPTHHDSNALVLAVHNGHQACVDMLFDVSDVDDVLEIVLGDITPHNVSVVDAFEERVVAKRQRAVLENSVGQKDVARPKRKI